MTFDEIFARHHENERNFKNIIKNISNDPSIYYLDNLYHSSGIDIFDTVMLNAKKEVLIVSHEPLYLAQLKLFSGYDNRIIYVLLKNIQASEYSM